ncbi:MAG TPA: histidine phosphatase family protein [Acidobacteriaceae bacterium]|jgi:probable phosphoglycerate mutase
MIAVICRHGETDLNAGNRFRGWLDVPLDSAGEEQAEAAASFLTLQYDIKRIISSPLLRAFTTAQLFSKMAELPVSQDRGLLPWHVGILSGLPKNEAMPALKLFVQNPHVSIPNGESLQDFETRACEFYTREFKEAESEGLTAMFAHTSNVTVLENLVSGCRGGEPESGETVKPGGICAVWFDGEKYEVEPVFGKPEAANYGS